VDDVFSGCDDSVGKCCNSFVSCLVCVWRCFGVCIVFKHGLLFLVFSDMFC